MLDTSNMSLPHFLDIWGGGVLGEVLTSNPEELMDDTEEEEEDIESV